MKRKSISSVLCLVMIFALAVPAFAVNNIGVDEGDSIIQRRWDTEYYINASNVHLRSGPGTSYSSGGLVQNGNILVKRSVDGSTTHYDSSGNEWTSVRMITGPCATLNGYVLSSYISSRRVPGIDYGIFE